MKRHLALAGALLLTTAAMQATTDIKPVPFTQVHVTDNFWSQRLETLRSKTIRYAFQKCTDAGQIKNFEIAGKVLSGELKKGSDLARYQSGTTYDDAEVYKVIEGASYLLTVKEDKELEAYIDGVIDLIASAQESDGYLFTNWTIANPLHEWMNGAKWTSDWNLSHETFDMGELIEAGVAYYYATGKDKLLNVARRAADVMCETFKEGGLGEAPGHAVVEMALVRLYEVTGDEKYLNECKYFLDTRGHRSGFDPNSDNLRVNGKYWQNHAKAVDQREAVGHAVRAVYLYTGMADVAKETQDETLLAACHNLWESITKRRMYITGGIGSTFMGEAFTVDYDLPNDTVYAETCASIGLMFFAKKMLENEHRGEYADVMERAFYNTVLAGMQLDGKRFFYVNPLEVVPGISGKAVTHRAVLPTRPQWYACACCPPNVARMVSSFGSYAYSENEDTFFIDLYAGGTVKTEKGITLTCETDFPHGGTAKYTIKGETETTVAIRIPAWSEKSLLTVNGEAVDLNAVTKDGYAYITRAWKDGDTLALTMDMTPHVVYASAKIAADSGKVCVQRGALVYCAEEVDNGKVLPLYVKAGAEPKALDFEPETLGGIVPVEIAGCAQQDIDTLYSTKAPKFVEKTIRLIPYYTWANRGENQMRVWLPVK